MEFDQDELVRLAEDDPERCLTRCDEIIDSASQGDVLASAHRAKGVALRHLGDLHASIAELSLAASSFDEIGDESSRAESLISLSASVAMTGEIEKGISILDDLLNHDMPTVKAHALVQRAGLLWHVGDLKSALSEYESAMPLLVALDDEEWQSIVHTNRGVVYAYEARFDEAEADLMAGWQLDTKLHKAAFVARDVHNLGWLAVWRGNIAEGIQTLLDAEGLFHRAGLPHEIVTLDRAYAYMLAGLTSDALETALSVANDLESRSAELHRFDALLIAARAALADGQPDVAMSTAGEGLQLAESQGRVPWRLMAELVLEEARYVSKSPGSDLTSLRGLAQGLEENLYPSAAVHAWSLAALRAVEERDLVVAREFLLAGADRSPEIELTSRLIYALAEAKYQEVNGDLVSTLDVLSAAADLVDEHRILLSTTEARVGVARLTIDIARLGLDLIHSMGRSGVEWVDRFRGASLRIAPVVRSDDPELEAALGELRNLVRESEERRKAGIASAEDGLRARELERRIKTLGIRARGAARTRFSRPTIDEITESLDGACMLYLYDVGGAIRGEKLTSKSSEPVFVSPSPRLRTLAQHMASAFRRQFMFPKLRDRTASAALATIDELGSAILESVCDVEELVVVPPPDLVSLPWGAMATRVRRDLTVVVAPSAGAWIEAKSHELTYTPLGVISGPRLEYGPAEADRVVSVYADETVALTGRAATVSASANLMGMCGNFHAVAHTRLRHDNPMFSALELADGMLNLYDLEQLERVPSLVTLSACDSAHGDVVASDEMYGLTSLLLSGGSRSVIATVAPIPDSAQSVDAVARIHSELAAGASPARAINLAQIDSELATVDPSLAFVAYGA